MSSDGLELGAGSQGVTIWLTGLPSAGKSTIAGRLAEVLSAWNLPVELLDGDEIREWLSKGLGFSRQDRDENVRRISHVARLLTRHGVIAIVAATSPFRSTRDEARAAIGRFIEVHVNCLLDECVRRDVKGLYKKALAGEIRQFTGISDPYEEPVRPEVVVDTHAETLDESVGKVLAALGRMGYVPTGRETVLAASAVTGGAPAAAGVSGLVASE
jgi:adenylylsulfate kinase